MKGGQEKPWHKEGETETLQAVGASWLGVGPSL